MKARSTILLTSILIPGLFGCAAKFSFNDPSSATPNTSLSVTPAGTGTGTGTPPVTTPLNPTSIEACDPATETLTTQVTNGLYGNYYYLDSTQTRYTTSADYVAHGHQGLDDIYTGEINFPTHDFSVGLTLDGNTPLKDNSGNALTEYFAVALNSRINSALTISRAPTSSV